jgi:hypothetical protein
LKTLSNDSGGQQVIEQTLTLLTPKVVPDAAPASIDKADPLSAAWQLVQKELPKTNEARFLALCRNLQAARPEEDIALPLQRIAGFMGLHWTTVGKLRTAAVKNGVLDLRGEYVAHSLAGRYRFKEISAPETLAKPSKNFRLEPSTAEVNKKLRQAEPHHGKDVRTQANYSEPTETNLGINGGFNKGSHYSENCEESNYSENDDTQANYSEPVNDESDFGEDRSSDLAPGTVIDHSGSYKEFEF